MGKPVKNKALHDEFESFKPKQGKEDLHAEFASFKPKAPPEEEMHGEVARPDGYSDPGALTSGVVGAAQGITGGHLDEIAAFIASKAKGTKYEKELEGARARLGRLRNDHKVAMPAGEVAGTAGRYAATGMGVGSMAANGALEGAGNSAGDVVDKIGSAIKGGAIGAATGKVGEAIGAAGKGVADRVRKYIDQKNLGKMAYRFQLASEIEDPVKRAAEFAQIKANPSDVVNQAKKKIAYGVGNIVGGWAGGSVGSAVAGAPGAAAGVIGGQKYLGKPIAKVVSKGIDAAGRAIPKASNPAKFGLSKAVVRIATAERKSELDGEVAHQIEMETNPDYRKAYLKSREGGDGK